MRFTRTIAAALALSVGALTLAGSAEARDRDNRWRHHDRHHHNSGAPYAAGAVGFAAGAILGSALSQPRYYYEPAPVYVEPRYVAPRYVAPTYVQPSYVQPSYVYAAPSPWTPGWYAYCEDRYRSFNRGTGYFVGFDGGYHFCQ